MQKHRRYRKAVRFAEVVLVLLQFDGVSSWMYTTAARVRRSRSYPTIGVSSNPNGDDLSDNDRRAIQDELGQLFRLRPSDDWSSRSNDDFDYDIALGGYSSSVPYTTADELQAYVEQRAHNQNASASSAFGNYNYTGVSSDDDDAFSALSLDADAYLKAEGKWATLDGSLPKLSMAENRKELSYPNRNDLVNRQVLWSAPIAPSTAGMPPPSVDLRANTDSDDDLTSLTELWNAMKQTPVISTGTTTSEDLHRQVFVDETGYLNQSHLFLESLVNASQADDAWTLRHGNVYRAKQQQAMELLEQQIQEIESNLQMYSRKKGVARCSKCHCVLDPTEKRANEGVRQKICQVCHADEFIQTSPGSGSTVRSSRLQPLAETQAPLQQQLSPSERETTITPRPIREAKSTPSRQDISLDLEADATVLEAQTQVNATAASDRRQALSLNDLDAQHTRGVPAVLEDTDYNAPQVVLAPTATAMLHPSEDKITAPTAAAAMEIQSVPDLDAPQTYVVTLQTESPTPCPVDGCPFSAEDTAGMRRHFQDRHWEDTIIVESEGLLPQCSECGIFQRDVGDKHKATALCQRNAAKLKKRNEAMERKRITPDLVKPS